MESDPSSSDTKKEILKSATRFLRRQSYNSFSYNDIAEEVGIKKPSIHYHFPTKDILGVEAVKYYKELIIKYITKLENHTEKPLEKLDSFFEFFRTGIEKDYLCPGVVLSVEFNTLNTEMKEILQSLFNYYTTWLAEVLEQGREQGDLEFEEDSLEKAFFVASATEGAMVLARAYQLLDHYDSTVDQIKKTIIPQ
jgi:TetR/AcrR family transcriptional repressor of nem operon